MPGFTNKVISAQLLGGGKLKSTATGQDTTINLPKGKTVATNSVVAVKFSGSLQLK